MKKIIAFALTTVFCLFAVTSCSGGSYTKTTLELTETEEVTDTVLMKVKNFGDIVIKLDATVAPITVANFQKLVSEGFYDGLTFHRVISGFMIQGGCPFGTGTGGSGTEIKGEFSENGVENNLKHTRGVISMARSSEMDSASSQFFIVHQTSSHLDGSYAAFGEVIDGMSVVDAIAAVETDYNDKPLSTVQIEEIVFVTVNE